MIKDKNGKILELGIWYMITDNDYNPYQYLRFVLPVTMQDRMVLVLELERNSNNPDLAPSIRTLPKEFFTMHKAENAEETHWSSAVKQVFNKSQHTYIIQLFEAPSVNKAMEKLRR